MFQEIEEKVFKAIEEAVAQAVVLSASKVDYQLHPPAFNLVRWASSRFVPFQRASGSRFDFGVPEFLFLNFEEEELKTGGPLELMGRNSIELLAGLLVAVRPERSLVFGGGTGVVPLLMHQLVRNVSALAMDRPGPLPTVTSVELGDKAPSLGNDDDRWHLLKKWLADAKIRLPVEHIFIRRGSQRGLLAQIKDPTWLGENADGLFTATDIRYFLAQLKEDGGSYSFIAVDGPHHREQIVHLLTIAWSVLEPGGVFFVAPRDQATEEAIDVLSSMTGTQPYWICERGFGSSARFFIKGQGKQWVYDPSVIESLGKDAL